MALSLGGEIAPISTPAAPAAPAVAQLVPLQESSLALVGTLLITTLPSSSSHRGEPGPGGDRGRGHRHRVGVHRRSGRSGPGRAGAGSGRRGRFRRRRAPAPPGPGKAEAEPAAPSWQNRVLGTDEALERFDREHPELPVPARRADPEPADRPGKCRPRRRARRPLQSSELGSRDRRLERSTEAIEDVADRRVGETHQEFDHMHNGTGGFHPPYRDALEPGHGPLRHLGRAGAGGDGGRGVLLPFRPTETVDPDRDSPRSWPAADSCKWKTCRSRPRVDEITESVIAELDLTLLVFLIRGLRFG